MSKKQNSISLQFPDMRLLWQFAQTLTSKSIEINTHTNMLICDCSTEEITLATTQYRARILEGVSLKNSY